MKKEKSSAVIKSNEKFESFTIIHSLLRVFALLHSLNQGPIVDLLLWDVLHELYSKTRKNNNLVYTYKTGLVCENKEINPK